MKYDPLLYWVYIASKAVCDAVKVPKVGSGEAWHSHKCIKWPNRAKCQINERQDMPPQYLTFILLVRGCCI